MDNYILELKNIMKLYNNGVVANKKVNFELKEGEIHAIVGENGAGKSTLMKILFGMEQPTSGEIFFKGKKTNIEGSDKAIEMGIGMVHQHFMLVPSFTIAQNMILGMEPKKGISIDYNKATDMIKDLIKVYNLKVDPNMKTEDLSVGMKQKVEILKALLRGAKILILDEPTAVLTPQETDELFVQLKKLKENGHTIIFISHKLREVKSICDRVTVIKKGLTMGTYNVSDMTEQEISNIMIGRDVVLKYDKRKNEKGEALLKVENLSYKGIEGNYILKDINFTLNRGNILGIAGIEGNGQRELISIITGNKKNYEGNVFLGEKSIQKLSIGEIKNYGMSYIPEDRMTDGVAKEAFIMENLIGNRYKSSELNNGLLFDMNKINKLSEELVSSYDVVCKDIEQKVESLSGGNIQKIVVARECSIDPEVLIAEQPTRGVDVGAAHFIHEEIIKLRDDKTAVLLVSADLNEAMELSDSLIVMFEGKIVAYFEDVKETDEEELGLYMLGIKRQSEEEIRRAIDEC
ncbi:ABC transporter ATP-binding protein [Clostridium sp. D2Q-14]|uniref:ABC transporter ATP-binding protein n=1 Tax=Anaeromonas gelatinilytica TaxID=2683194 RepID=UPI00193AE514|nr:ABC transporter ATP-binding protein [Anaeromonas gelatinilytica]MBS4536767.1 ABC transporter ATP-binding protein [Anaeromonas gelatinilytica]